jgi:hypothetical protein
VAALGIAVLVAIGGTVQLAAQTEGGDAGAQANSGYTISGTVVNSVTGEPVRHALVQVANLPGNPPSMLTNSEGRFQFEHVPPTDVLIMARKPGFFSEQELHPEGVLQTQLLHVDRNTSDLAIKLFPEGTIAGRVATVKGEPLEDTPVRAFQQRVADGRKRWAQLGQSTTDEDGQFHIGNLVAGQYLLVAGPTYSVGRMRVRGKGTVRQEEIVASYYPGVPDVEAATPVGVVSGQQLQADFALTAQPIFKVAGTVATVAGTTLTSVQIMTRSGEAVGQSVNLDPPTGKFTAEVPAGTYLVTALAPDANGNQFEGSLAITVNSDIDNVAVAIGAPLVLPVKVEERRTESAGSSNRAEGLMDISSLGTVEIVSGNMRHRVTAEPFRIPPVQVRLISAENQLQASEYQADNTGNVFAVRNFTPGRYTVDIQPNGRWYVQSARSGNVDLLREELVIGSGRRPDPIEIVVRDDGANLSGSIHADGQAASGSVLVIPEQEGPSQIRVVHAAPGGDFLVDRLAPGDYKLLGVDSLDGFEFRNPEVLGSYLSKATRISLQANQQASVTVERVQIGK